MKAWVAAYLKRILASPALWLALLALPALALLARSLAPSPAAGLRVGLLKCGDECVFSAQQELQSSAGLLRFELFEDAAAMEQAVAVGELAAAYSFSPDFTESYLAGQGEGLAERIAPPGSTYAPLVDEAVFAALFDAVAPKLAGNFAAGYERIPDGERAHARVLAEEAYALFKSTVGTVFEYRTLGGGVVEAAAAATFPVLGVGAALAQLAALLGINMALQDAASGLFARLSPGRRLVAGASATAPAPLLVLLALLAANGIYGWRGAAAELGQLAVLWLGVAALAAFLAALPGSSNWLCFALPPLALVQLVLCPVFFDMAAFVPAAALLARVLPAYWYMQPGGLWGGLACAGAWAALAALLYAVRRFGGRTRRQKQLQTR